MRLLPTTWGFVRSSVSSQVILQKSYSSQRGPKASTFKQKPTKNHTIELQQAVDQSSTDNLTKLSQDASIHLKKQALEMYESCRLSNRDSITRFAIVRQMRNLDLPPHREVWQGINPTDELQLYRWINEAFGQLLYMKKLWKPCLDWSPEDDQTELELNHENYQLLQIAYQDQIVNPLKNRFGDDQVTIALSNLRDDEQLYIKPAIIWRSKNMEGEISLEWMSELTADVIWPGLVSCKPEYEVARRYWESEAKKFSESMGGVPCGMSPDGQMLAADDKVEELTQHHHQQQQNPYQFEPSFLHSAKDHQRLAEAVLIKKFLQERNTDQIKSSINDASA